MKKSRIVYVKKYYKSDFRTTNSVYFGKKILSFPLSFLKKDDIYNTKVKITIEEIK